MINKEAIEKLKELSFMTGYKEAIDIAISALERDGTISFEDGESTVCACPVCGSIWKIVETNKSGTWN